MGVMNKENHDRVGLDEKGLMSEATLDKMARCPYCGRFMKRGLVNFLEHARGDCPHHKVIVYSPDRFDVNTTDDE
jgi:hypothetical protein